MGTEALASGVVTRRALSTKYRAVYRNVYLSPYQELTAGHRAVAAWLWSNRQATVAGLSAAALHGSRWIDAHLPAELYRPNGKPVAGLIIHRDELCDDEICIVQGMPVTTPARTGFDLGRRKGLESALIRLDALGNATGLMPKDVNTLIPRHPGVRGLVQLRRVLTLMDPARSRPKRPAPAWC